MGRDPETRPAARTARLARRASAAAALTYVIAAGVENMEVLGAPGFGASADAIRAAYADTALATVTWLAGALSLLAYAAFARGLQRLAPRRLAFAGAAAGVLLAAAGLAAAGVLVAPGGTDRPDDTVRALHELQLALRLLAGPAMALFLAAAGLTAARAGVLRTWQGGLAAGCAVPLALTPIAAVSQSPVLVAAAFVAFGLHALWIWLAGLQLAVALDVRRSAFLMLVLAAGLVGLALLVVPGATSKFFAWELAPEGLAAFAGGVYVGSAVVYGVALAAGDRAVRGLVAGAVVLSVSVLVITLAHRAVFDFDRLQAWAWVVLFAGFGLTTTALLVRGAGAGPRAADPLRPSPAPCWRWRASRWASPESPSGSIPREPGCRRSAGASRAPGPRCSPCSPSGRPSATTRRRRASRRSPWWRCPPARCSAPCARATGTRPTSRRSCSSPSPARR